MKLRNLLSPKIPPATGSTSVAQTKFRPPEKPISFIQVNQGQPGPVKAWDVEQAMKHVQSKLSETEASRNKNGKALQILDKQVLNLLGFYTKNGGGATDTNKAVMHRAQAEQLSEALTSLAKQLPKGDLKAIVSLIENQVSLSAKKQRNDLLKPMVEKSNQVLDEPECNKQSTAKTNMGVGIDGANLPTGPSWLSPLNVNVMLSGNYNRFHVTFTNEQRELIDRKGKEYKGKLRGQAKLDILKKAGVSADGNVSLSTLKAKSHLYSNGPKQYADRLVEKSKDPMDEIYKGVSPNVSYKFFKNLTKKNKSQSQDRHQQSVNTSQGVLNQLLQASGFNVDESSTIPPDSYKEQGRINTTQTSIKATGTKEVTGPGGKLTRNQFVENKMEVSVYIEDTRKLTSSDFALRQDELPAAPRKAARALLQGTQAETSAGIETATTALEQLLKHEQRYATATKGSDQAKLMANLLPKDHSLMQSLENQRREKKAIEKTWGVNGRFQMYQKMAVMASAFRAHAGAAELPDKMRTLVDAWEDKLLNLDIDQKDPEALRKLTHGGNMNRLHFVNHVRANTESMRLLGVVISKQNKQITNHTLHSSETYTGINIINEQSTKLTGNIVGAASDAIDIYKAATNNNIDTGAFLNQFNIEMSGSIAQLKKTVANAPFYVKDEPLDCYTAEHKQTTRTDSAGGKISIHGGELTGNVSVSDSKVSLNSRSYSPDNLYRIIGEIDRFINRGDEASMKRALDSYFEPGPMQEAILAAADTYEIPTSLNAQTAEWRKKRTQDFVKGDEYQEAKEALANLQSGTGRESLLQQAAKAWNTLTHKNKNNAEKRESIQQLRNIMQQVETPDMLVANNTKRRLATTGINMHDWPTRKELIDNILNTLEENFATSSRKQTKGDTQNQKKASLNAIIKDVYNKPSVKEALKDLKFQIVDLKSISPHAHSATVLYELIDKLSEKSDSAIIAKARDTLKQLTEAKGKEKEIDTAPLKEVIEMAKANNLLALSEKDKVEEMHKRLLSTAKMYSNDASEENKNNYLNAAFQFHIMGHIGFDQKQVMEKRALELDNKTNHHSGIKRTVESLRQRVNNGSQQPSPEIFFSDANLKPSTNRLATHRTSESNSYNFASSEKQQETALPKRDKRKGKAPLIERSKEEIRAQNILRAAKKTSESRGRIPPLQIKEPSASSRSHKPNIASKLRFKVAPKYEEDKFTTAPSSPERNDSFEAERNDETPYTTAPNSPIRD